MKAAHQLTVTVKPLDLLVAAIFFLASLVIASVASAGPLPFTLDQTFDDPTVTAEEESH